MDSRLFRNLFAISLLVADVTMLVLAFMLAHRLRLTVQWPAEAVDLGALRDYVGVMGLYVLAVVGVFYAFRLYHLPRATSRIDQFFVVVGGLGLGTLLAVALAALAFRNSVFEVNWPRMMVAYGLGLSVVLVALARWALQGIRDGLQTLGLAQDRLIIVGVGETAASLAHKISSVPFLGYELVGLVGATPEKELFGLPVLGVPDDTLTRLIDDLQVDEVIIAMPEAPHEERLRLISLCYRNRVSIKISPDVYDIITAGVTIDDLGGLPLLSVRDVALRGWKVSLKRAMDIAGSVLGLVLLSPLLLLLAIMVKLDSKGPAFFVQWRMGLDDKQFPMLKFRSMRTDSEVGGPGWTVKGDPRVTRLGRFIRRTSIDELPQLINILLGHMSLVGPRPEQPAFVEQFRKIIPRYMERHREKAGLTGWAQVNGLRGDTSIEERTKYDLWYIENWSVWLDIKIVLLTAFSILFDRNAY